jgi:hypothetical protein
MADALPVRSTSLSPASTVNDRPSDGSHADSRKCQSDSFCRNAIATNARMAVGSKRTTDLLIPDGQARMTCRERLFARVLRVRCEQSTVSHFLAAHTVIGTALRDSAGLACGGPDSGADVKAAARPVPPPSRMAEVIAAYVPDLFTELSHSLTLHFSTIDAESALVRDRRFEPTCESATMKPAVGTL